MKITINNETFVNAFISAPKIDDILPHFFYLVQEEKDGFIKVFCLTLNKIFEIEGTSEDVEKISDTLFEKVTLLSLQYLYSNWRENKNNFNIDETPGEYYTAFNKIILYKKLNKLNNYFECLSVMKLDIENEVNSLYKEISESSDINSFIRKQKLTESQIEEIDEIAKKHGDTISELLDIITNNEDN